MFRQFVGYSVLIQDVTYEELSEFEDFCETIPSVGYQLFWSGRSDRAVLLIEMDGGQGTWLAKTLPALERYWGKDRIIHNVEQVPAELVDDPPEDMPPVPHNSMSTDTYNKRMEAREQQANATRPAFQGNPRPNVPPRRPQ